MLQDAFAGLEAQVQPFESRITLLQNIDDTQRLQIVLEASVVLHALVERVLASMAERRMSEVVRQRYRLDQVFVEAQIARHRTSYLRDFDAMGQSRAKKIAFVVHENLGLVLEATKRRGVDDAVAIPLKFGASDGGGFVELPAAGACGIGGVGRQVIHAPPLPRALPASPASRNPPSWKPCPKTEAIP